MERFDRLRTKPIFREAKRYIKYSVVGSGGMAINFVLLYLLTDHAHLQYIFSATIGIVAAASFNYVLNHIWSFRDVRQNNTDYKIGWTKFVLAKAAGDVAYLGLLAFFTEMVGMWYMLSAVLSTIITVVPGYVLISWWVWNKKVWNLQR